MNQEQKLNILTDFANNRMCVLNSIESFSSKNTSFQTQEVHEIDEIEYTKSLMQTPISKLSKFSDGVWDFNEDYPNVARSIQGDSLRINFSRHQNIPIFVIAEIKVLFYLALLNNLIFKTEFNTKTYKNIKRRRVKGSIKPQTLTVYFNKGLSFLNHLFKETIEELGSEFVHKNISTLADLSYEMYVKSAENFEQVADDSLDRFFKYLYSPSACEYVFSKPLPFVDINQLNWKKRSTRYKNKKIQVIPNESFETLSKVSSLIVVDFLHAIGDDKKIADTTSFENWKVSKHSSWASEEKINRESLNVYTALRLRQKKYSVEYIENTVEPYGAMFTKHSTLKSAIGMRKILGKLGYKVESLNEYFNLVGAACIYLVGQYTGMRPSELAEIRVQNIDCLTEENGIWLIKSSVKKHVQEINTGLFDDKWVAIPIVRDALLASSYISKFKASPYLLAHANTLAPNEKARSMDGNGVKYQINKLITTLLGEKTAHAIKFHPYMLRHTLTYQLYRVDIGLSIISFQLKHFVHDVEKYTTYGATSQVTLGYGGVGEILSKDGYRKGRRTTFRQEAESEAVKIAFNPNGVYYGAKGKELKNKLTKFFVGYGLAGYNEEEVYEALVNQGVGVVNVGQGLCYGQKSEDFDNSLPCLGSLRCNPARCSQAVVTKSHAPKWREIYLLNKINLNKPDYAYNRENILAAMNEAKMVLEHLGEEVEL